MRRKSIAPTYLVIVAAVCLGGAALSQAGVGRPKEVARLDGDSAAAFLQVQSVLTHPRCMNCHTLTDYPRQGDDRHPHIMNVRRGPENSGVTGMTCNACHGAANNPASGVPGAEDWKLAPLSMGWEGLSAHNLCEAVKDPAKNGGRTGQQVLDHLQTHLVVWAWDPGRSLGGGPRTSPPLSHAAFVEAAQRWIRTGAACPPR